MTSKMRREKIWNQCKNILIILLGNTIYALAVVMFIIPNNLITGGTTGLGLFFQHEFGISLTMFVSAFNILMFILGAIVLGKKFALTTLLSTFYYPIILGILQKIPQLTQVTNNEIIAVVYAGIMIGLGIGIVIRAGASTGGMDIPPLVLNKTVGIPVSLSLYVLDFGILLLQFMFAEKEQVLIGILLVLLYTYILDKVLLVGQSQIQVKIISKKYEEINEQIIHKLDRGSTLMNGETGLYREDCKVILTVVNNRELTRLNQMVLDLDPNAFMIINKVNEVKGRGFTLDKIYKRINY